MGDERSPEPEARQRVGYDRSGAGCESSHVAGPCSGTRRSWPFLRAPAGGCSGSLSMNPVPSADGDEGEVMTRVLIVEDDPVTARLLEEGLRDDGYDVHRRGERRRGHPRRDVEPLRRDRDGRHAARRRRVRDLPVPPGARHRHPDPAADRAGRGGRPGARPRHGRRRLPREAVRLRGVRRPHPGAPAPQQRPRGGAGAGPAPAGRRPPPSSRSDGRRLAAEPPGVRGAPRPPRPPRRSSSSGRRCSRRSGAPGSSNRTIVDQYIRYVRRKLEGRHRPDRHRDRARRRLPARRGRDEAASVSGASS